MNDFTVALLEMYEERVDHVEVLVGESYLTALETDKRVREFRDEREQLEKELETILARNCSVRRKDFKSEMQKVLSSLSIAEDELTKERDSLVSEVKEYLSREKELIGAIRSHLSSLIEGGGSGEDLKNSVEEFKASRDANGSVVLRKLREFQEKIRVFEKERRALNGRVRLLVERGKQLKIEDIRRLTSARLTAARESEKRLRREEVRRFLDSARESRRRRKKRPAGK